MRKEDNKFNLINLTPHAIHLYSKGKKVMSIPSTFPHARVAKEDVIEGFIPYKGIDIPVATTRYGKTYNLPSPVRDTYYIVSIMVKQAHPNRSDLLTVGGMVRDKEKQVTGFEHFLLGVE